MIDEKKIEQIVNFNVDAANSLIPDSPLADCSDTLKKLMVQCVKKGIKMAKDEASEESGHDKYVLSWEYEDLDNGCTLADTESCFKECAESDDKDCSRAYMLLGRWLYNELQAFKNEKLSSRVRIKISLETLDKEQL